MSQSPDPETLRLVRMSVRVGYLLALAGGVIALVANELSLRRAVLDALVVTLLLAVPPSLALLSSSGRPLLLLAAGLTGVATIYGLGVLGMIGAVLGLIWLWAYLRSAPAGRWLAKAGMVAVPLLWLAASASLWAHLDPACEQTLRDGSVVAVDPASRGLATGWTWQVGDTVSGSSPAVSSEVVSEACTSNRLLLWELGVATSLAGAALVVGFILAGTAESRTEPIASLAG